ncbi:hypothetical protein AMTRI_Chr02g219620 [Amborella trichopoda]
MDQVRSDEAQPNYALTGKIMMSAVVVLFTIVLLILFLHIYARCFLIPQATRRTRARRRHRAAGSVNTHHLQQASGLEPALLVALPTFDFDPSNPAHQGLADCAVCLCEFEAGEMGRFLPACGHGFHTECIDMWFLSHSTCPLCRKIVKKGDILNGVPQIQIVIDPAASGAVQEASSVTASGSGSGSAKIGRSLSFDHICSSKEGLDNEESSSSRRAESFRKLRRMLSSR